MIKDILVNLPLRAVRDRTTPFAASMAGYFNAHITGIAFVYEPVVPVIEMGAVVPASFFHEQVAEAKRLAQHAVERFRYEIKREGLNWAVHQVEAPPSEIPGRFAKIARGFDLAVVSQADSSAPGIDDMIAEATLFESGRPTLVVPYIQRPPFRIDHVALCWDGSRQATRAVADAIPLLHRAKRVDLLSVVGERPLREELTGADMLSHLSRHGIKAEVQKLSMAGTDAAPAILNFVADSAADLLVMGGYGHSQLREFILGGATRDLLRSMTVPVLLAH